MFVERLEFPTQTNGEEPFRLQLQTVDALINWQLHEDVGARIRGEFRGQSGAEKSKRAAAVGRIGLGSVLSVFTVDVELKLGGEPAGVQPADSTAQIQTGRREKAGARSERLVKERLGEAAEVYRRARKPRCASEQIGSPTAKLKATVKRCASLRATPSIT